MVNHLIIFALTAYGAFATAVAIILAQEMNFYREFYQNRIRAEIKRIGKLIEKRIKERLAD